MKDEYYYTDYPEYFTQEDDPFDPIENNTFDPDLEDDDDICPDCDLPLDECVCDDDNDEEVGV